MLTPSHLLLYVIYLYQKSQNFIYAFICYKQKNVKWCHLMWATLYIVLYVLSWQLWLVPIHSWNIALLEFSMVNLIIYCYLVDWLIDWLIDRVFLVADLTWCVVVCQCSAHCIVLPLTDVANTHCNIQSSTNPLLWKQFLFIFRAPIGNGTSGIKWSRDPERSRSWSRYIWMQISWERLNIEARL